MSNGSKKIAAFTVMDLLTGMVIMSIIIAIVFYLIGNTNQQVFRYAHSRSDVIAFSLLKENLNQTVEGADRIVGWPNGFKVVSGSKGVAFFQDGNLLMSKEEGRIDTVFENIESIRTFILKTKGGEEKINKILINLFIGNKKLKLYIYKSYGSQAIVNFQMLDEYQD